MQSCNLRNIYSFGKELKMFVNQVGGSRKYDLESTSWTESSLISSHSLGLKNCYSAAEGHNSQLRYMTSYSLALTKFATCRFP